MRQLRENARDFYWDGRIAKPHDARGSRRKYDDIGANSGLPGTRIMQHTQREADDHQDQRHFERNCDDADDRPDWPMRQVGDDQLVHHGGYWLPPAFGGCCALSRWITCAPGGSSSTNLSLVSG